MYKYNNENTFKTNCYKRDLACVYFVDYGIIVIALRPKNNIILKYHASACTIYVQLRDSSDNYDK